MMAIDINKVKTDLEEKYENYLSTSQLLKHCQRWNKLVRSGIALHHASIEPDIRDIMTDRLIEKMKKERTEIRNITTVSKFFDIEIEFIEMDMEIKLIKVI